MTLILILPAALLISLVFLFPLVHYLWLSSKAFSVMTGLVAINNNGANWIRLLNDQRFWQDIYQTTRFAITSVSLELLLAIIIAIILDQRIKGRGLIRAITLLPWALPTAVMALGWRWIFNSPYGPIEQITSLLGLEPINILSTPEITWMATVIADVWKTTPFIALIILAGLQSIPYDLYEALRLEGGNQYSAFIKITIPLISPYIFLSLVFRLAQAFGVFDLIQVMTGGGPASSTESIAMYAYINAMRFLDFGYSATIMIGSFLLLSTSCFLAYLIINQTKSLISNQKP